MTRQTVLVATGPLYALADRSDQYHTKAIHELKLPIKKERRVKSFSFVYVRYRFAMARPLRIEFPGAWYHVMNRGAGHRAIFNEGQHRSVFLELLGELNRMFHVEAHAYCLMGNHYHPLIHTPGGNLQRSMRHLNGICTQHTATG